MNPIYYHDSQIKELSANMETISTINNRGYFAEIKPTNRNKQKAKLNWK